VDLRDVGWRVSENTVAALLRERGLAARCGRGRKGHHSARRGPLACLGFGETGFRRRADQPEMVWRWHARSLPVRARCIWLRCWMWAPGGWWGSPCPSTTTPSWPTGHWRWRWGVRGGQVPGVIMHTDCGSEYTANLFRAACGRLQIRQSMGRAGSALDNAVIEAWHSTLTFELRCLQTFVTKTAARARVPAWIDHYNRERRHSACGMLSPIDYELAQARQAA